MVTPASEDLSEREIEILSLLATGASNKEIAQQLFISANTVKVHLRNIFAKIGVSSRTEAALYALKAGYAPGNAVVNLAGGEPRAVESDDGVKTELAELPAGETGIIEAAGSRKALIGVVIAIIVLFLAILVGVGLWAQRPEPMQSSAALITNAAPRWKTLAPMPEGRESLAVAANDHYIYAISGRTAAGVVGAGERYDLLTDSWSAIATKPTPVYEIGAAVIGGRIFIPGGRLETGEASPHLEIYDPREDVWSRGADLPEPLSAYGLAAFEGKLYLFGGWEGQKFSRMVLEYDPAADRWRRLDDMPTARAFMGTAVAAGKIFVIGGLNETGALATCDGYLPSGGESLSGAWSQSPDLPDARYAMGTASVADIIYVIGGKGPDEKPVTPVQFLPSMNAWAEIETPENYPLSSPGLAALEAYLYLIGGAASSGELSVMNQAYQAIYIIAVPIIR